MSDSKIQFKVGIVEFSGEGNQDWLAAQLDKILKTVPELLKIEVGNSIGSSFGSGKQNESATENAVGSKNSLSVLNIAGKLNSKSGSDLVIAAAAYLHFVEGKLNFTRDDILSNMKKATGIYKNSLLSNLSRTIIGMEKNSTLLKNGNTYSLNANKVSELDAILYR